MIEWIILGLFITWLDVKTRKKTQQGNTQQDAPFWMIVAGIVVGVILWPIAAVRLIIRGLR